MLWQAMIAAVLIPSVTARAQRPASPLHVPFDSTSWAGLVGVTGLTLGVEARSPGIDTAALRGRIELRLRQNGIDVGPSEFSYLKVDCYGMEAHKELFVPFLAACQLRVYGFVLLEAPTLRRALVPVYTRSFDLQMSDEKDVNRLIAEDLLDRMMVPFLNDWYRANPKRGR